MYLFRLIAIGLIVWLLYRMFRRLLDRPRPQERPPKQVDGQKMVRCAHCGIHIPQNEALERDGESYCSPEHRDAGPA
ncbi:MAG: PP0621 family protein [Pseudomonadota bacterium]